MTALATPASIERRLRALARDRRRGASELTVMGIRLVAAARPGARVAPAAYHAALRRLVDRVATARPAMVPIGAAVEHLWADFERAVPPDSAAADAHRAMAACARRLERSFLARVPKVAGCYRARYGRLRRILTISYSSQVLATLIGPGAGTRHVWVCESRPALEGRRTARGLLPHVGSVTLVTEAAVGQAAGACDMVLLGCDAIHADGSVVNKMGSSVLALAAYAAGLPVVVLGDRFKLTKPGPARSEGHARSEVWRGAPPGIHIENDYFEMVQARLIRGIVLEDRVYRPSEIRRVWESERKYRGRTVP